MSTDESGHAPPATRTVKLGDDFEVTVERPGGVKSSRAFVIMRTVSDRLPEIAEAWGAYQRDYQANHSTEVDRGYAMLRWGPQPLTSDGGPVLYPLKDSEGNPHPKAGEVVMVPSPLTAISEEGWAARGQKMTMPADPPMVQLAAAVFDKAMAVAEEHVYRLVALFTLTNREVNQAWLAGDGALDKLIDARVEELLTRSYGDELVELAVVCGEVVEASFVGKVRRLMAAGRMTSVLRLIGIQAKTENAPQTPAEGPQTEPQSDGESTSSPESTSPPSSTGSESNTDGDGETPSTPPTTSSSPSPSGSTPDTPVGSRT